MPALTSTRTALASLSTSDAVGGRIALQTPERLCCHSAGAVSRAAPGGGSEPARARSVRPASILDSSPGIWRTASYDLVLAELCAGAPHGLPSRSAARVREIPGVESAALANLPPLSGTLVGDEIGSLTTAQPRVASMTFLNGVGPDYFSTLRIPIARGRPFGDRDSRSAPGVVIVNQTLARRLWKSEDVVGRSVRFDSAQRPARSRSSASRRTPSTTSRPRRPRPFLYLPPRPARR